MDEPINTNSPTVAKVFVALELTEMTLKADGHSRTPKLIREHYRKNFDAIYAAVEQKEFKED